MNKNREGLALKPRQHNLVCPPKDNNLFLYFSKSHNSIEKPWLYAWISYQLRGKTVGKILILYNLTQE